MTFTFENKLYTTRKDQFKFRFNFREQNLFFCVRDSAFRANGSLEYTLLVCLDSKRTQMKAEDAFYFPNSSKIIENNTRGWIKRDTISKDIFLLRIFVQIFSPACILHSQLQLRSSAFLLFTNTAGFPMWKVLIRRCAGKKRTSVYLVAGQGLNVTRTSRARFFRNRPGSIAAIEIVRRTNVQTHERTGEPNGTDVRLSSRSPCSRSSGSPRTRRSSNSSTYSPPSSRPRTSCTCRCSWRLRTARTTRARSSRDPGWPCARSWDYATFWPCDSWWIAS